MRAWLAIPTLLVVALAACADQTRPLSNLPSDGTLPPGIPSGAEPIGVRPVLTGPYSGITDSRRVVIRDGAVWQTFWQEAVGNLLPPPQSPAVDFAQEMVIAASLGQRPTGGYDISIDAVYEAEGQLFVAVRETAPAPGSIVTQALSAPVAAVAAPRSDAPVVFVPASAPNP